jgi:hypothetical protein
MKIYEDVSKILGVYVTRDTISREVKILDVSGRVTQRKMLELIMLLIEKLGESNGETK